MKLKLMRIKFLGTSSGESIPREGCKCRQCSSTSTQDQRLRSCLLINHKILIDVGPDILQQLRPTSIRKLDMLIITHEHQDHVGGLKYVLKENPEIKVIRIRPGQHFKFEGIEFFAFKVEHSKIIPTVGLMINNLVYIPDVASLEPVLTYLSEVKTAILDGSVIGRSFGGHQAINDTIALTKKLRNLRKIYFTHNGHTKKTHREMMNLVRRLGGRRYYIAYDREEIKVN